MKLISILGYDRSGTTFLGSYFSNKSNEIFYAGEIDKGIEKYFSGKIKKCTCGSTYSSCQVWGRVFSAMSDPNDLHTLFIKLKEITGVKIIVDSSKKFSHLQKCKKIFGDDFYTVHIKRNPKGVILSRQKIRKSRIERNTHPKPEIAKRKNLMLVYDALEWGYQNSWMEKFKDKKNNLDLTYDLLETELEGKSQEFLSSLIGSLKKEPGNSLSDHIVWGNKGRFKSSNNIRVSTKWKSDLNIYQKILIDGLTFPIKIFYNYKY